MKTIPIIGGEEAIVDDADYERLAAYRWYFTAGYAIRKVGPWRQPYQLLMHRDILGLQKGDGRIVDHINGNPLDNRRENLRVCRHIDNMRNRGASRTNTSGFKGVSWHKNRKRWMANIQYEGKSRYLGSFPDSESAHEFYCLAADMLHGEFANHG